MKRFDVILTVELDDEGAVSVAGLPDALLPLGLRVVGMHTHVEGLPAAFYPPNPAGKLPSNLLDAIAGCSEVTQGAFFGTGLPREQEALVVMEWVRSQR